MLPKILLINLITMKMVLSQAVYSSAPTRSYPSTPVPSAQGYPSNLSPAATSSKPSPALTSAMPLTSSPTISVTTSSKPLSVSSSKIPALSTSIPGSSPAEAKAYFLPGPIADPKVTILSDMQSGIGAKPKIISITDPSIIELNRATDPGFIEVIGKFCDPQNTKLQGDISKPVLPAAKENTVSPVKRLTMACSESQLTDNEPILGAESLSYLQNQQVVCPGISKIDLALSPALVEGKINNPIEYEGLLNGFLTYLET